MALYGKYRPKTFADMVGQESTKQTLLSISKHNKFAHAFLFCGTRGTGKTTSARILAKAINCLHKNENGDPCNACELCQMAEENKMTDIIEIDAASNRGIDEVRSLIEKVAFQPNFGKSKIYIIDEVHMMTKEAFNALLKTLEEPPTHAFFILATTEFHKVPETIRSRCQTYFFRNIPLEAMKNRLEYICLQEHIAYTDEGLYMIAQRANGGLRDAISLLEQSSSYGTISKEQLHESLGIISPHTIEQFFQTITTHDTKESLAIVQALQNEGRSLEEFGKDILWYIRQQLHQSIAEKKSNIEILITMADIFQKALQKSKQFPFPSLAFEMAIAEYFIRSTDQSKLQKILDGDTPHAIAHIPTQNIIPASPAISQQAPVPIPEKIVPAPVSGISTTPPWEDDLMPHEVHSTSSSMAMNPHEDNTKIIAPQPPIEASDHTASKSQWETVLETLPKTLRMNIIQYGNITQKDESSVHIQISSPAVQTLVEKNKEKIAQSFEQFYKKPMHISITGILPEENKTPLTPKDLEGMFQF